MPMYTFGDTNAARNGGPTVFTAMADVTELRGKWDFLQCKNVCDEIEGRVYSCIDEPCHQYSVEAR